MSLKKNPYPPEYGANAARGRKGMIAVNKTSLELCQVFFK